MVTAKARVDWVITPQAWWMYTDEGLARIEATDKPPAVPEGAESRRVLLPLEACIVHPLSLPLASARLVDEQIVRAAVEDASGLSLDDWHFRWRVVEEERRLVGLAVGVSHEWKAKLEALAPQSVAVDAFSVLDAARSGDAPQAVLVEDEDGIFAGYWDGHLWRGVLRRASFAVHEACWEIFAALSAMDWREAPMVGELSQASEGLLATSGQKAWQGRMLEKLPTRAERAASAMEQAPFIELRSLDWAPAATHFEWRRWRRVAWLAAGMTAVWIAGSATELWRLEHQKQALQARIEAAFARALPNTPMIDPIAQLRQAAGGRASAVHTEKMLAMLAAVAEAKVQGLRALEFDADKGLVLSGNAKALAEVQALRERLMQHWPAGVLLLDSSIEEGGVHWRIRLQPQKR